MTNTRKTRRPKFGTISEGTLRTRDLIEAFYGELQYLNNTVALQVDKDHADAVTYYQGTEEDEYEETEGQEYLLEALFEALESLALPFTYFGAHQGDGADFGFWPCWDAINEGIHDGEVIVADLSELDEHTDSTPPYALLVNDHGNCTLYSRSQENGGYTCHKVWSCV